MRSLAVCAVLLFAGCDEEPVGNPSPIVPLRPPAVRPPPPAPPPPAPPPPAPAPPKKAAPTAQDLGAAFKIHQRTQNGYAMYEHHVVIDGDATGATLTEHTSDPDRASGEKQPTLTRHRLDAAAVAALLAKLDATEWWKLGDDGEDATDGTDHTLTLQRGTFSHQIHIYIGCACDSGRRPTEEPAADCTCPQLDVMALIGDAAKGLPKATRVTERAPEVKVFAPPLLALDAKHPRKAECVEGKKGALWCDRERCIRRGKKQADCYFAPTEQGHAVLVTKPVKPRRPLLDQPWAIQLADGRICAGSAEQEGFSCQDPKHAHSWGGEGSVQRLFPSGAGWLAVMQGSGEPQRVTAIWP